jgi:curved DNA-binding protein CbpA
MRLYNQSQDRNFLIDRGNQSIRNNDPTFRSDEFQNRSIKYKNEMDKIRENDDNAFRLYELPRDFTLRDLKKRYYKLSRVTHPDKHGGSDELFGIVTKYYLYLMDYYKRKQELLRQNDVNIGQSYKDIKKLRQEQNNELQANNVYASQLMDREKTKLKVGSGKSFDIKSFNKIFEENAFYDPSYEGYGNWLDKVGDENKKSVPKLFGKQFNKNVFNSVFEEERKNAKINNQIISIDDIKSFNYFDMNGANPIDDENEDFTTSVGNLTGLDLKQAYTTGIMTGVQNPSELNIKNFKNTQEYQKYRDSQMTPMSLEEKKRMQMMENMEKQRDHERMLKIQQRDMAIAKNYNNIKGLIMN